jgi:hypothetical protein
MGTEPGLPEAQVSVLPTELPNIIYQSPFTMLTTYECKSEK